MFFAFEAKKNQDLLPWKITLKVKTLANGPSRQNLIM
jgi:hypothetical protein